MEKARVGAGACSFSVCGRGVLNVILRVLDSTFVFFSSDEQQQDRDIGGSEVSPWCKLPAHAIPGRQSCPGESRAELSTEPRQDPTT